MCLNQQKRHSVRACSFLTVFFVCAAIIRVNLAFGTTIIEDTHLTLAVILFKVEANNSLIFLPLQIQEKKFAEFPFLLVYNSLYPQFISVLLNCREPNTEQRSRQRNGIDLGSRPTYDLTSGVFLLKKGFSTHKIEPQHYDPCHVP